MIILIYKHLSGTRCNQSHFVLYYCFLKNFYLKCSAIKLINHAMNNTILQFRDKKKELILSVLKQVKFEIYPEAILVLDVSLIFEGNEAKRKKQTFGRWLLFPKVSLISKYRTWLRNDIVRRLVEWGKGERKRGKRNKEIL